MLCRRHMYCSPPGPAPCLPSPPHEAFIQFTLEPDENGKLAFLDTVIRHHPDGYLSTMVHRKAPHTDKYLDFRSNHPLAHKIAVPRTLFSTARSLCTYVEDLDQEVSHGMKALKWNGYPKSAIKMSYPQRQQANTNIERPSATVVLPYIRGLSEPIQRILAPLHIRTCFCPYRTLSNILVHPKHPVPPDQRKGIVYRISCADCDMTYVGQTGRTLQVRRKEHVRALTNANPQTSALAKYALAHQRGTKPRFGFQPTSEPKMCIRGMAYSFPAPPYEQRVWSGTSSV